MGEIQIRDDIVLAAAQVFGRLGYERATLTDVAKAIGMRKPSLYHHIQSKEDLLFAIHNRLVDELMANTRDAIARGGSPEERLAAVLRVAMRLIAEHQQEVTVFLHERHVLGSERWRGVVAKRDAYQEMIEEIISEGVEQGVFRSLPVNVVTLGLLGMTNWGYQWFRLEGPLSADEIADVFIDLVLGGLRHEDARPS